MEAADADALTLGASAIADDSYISALHGKTVPSLQLREEHDGDINDALVSTLCMTKACPARRFGMLRARAIS